MNKLLLFCVIFLFLGCASQNVRTRELIAISTNSNRARLLITLSKEGMEVTITNLQDKTLAIDSEMEIWFEYHIFDRKGKRIPIQHTSDVGEPISKRYVYLKPHESYSKKFRKGDKLRGFFVMHSYEGKTALGEYLEIFPSPDDIGRIDVRYSCRGMIYLIPGMLKGDRKLDFAEQILKANASTTLEVLPGINPKFSEPFWGDIDW